jgi:prophage regulatory protein
MVERILRRRELRAVTGYGTTRINELIAEGRFPRPIKLGERAVGWLESEVSEWQQQRIAASRGTQNNSPPAAAAEARTAVASRNGD